MAAKLELALKISAKSTESVSENPVKFDFFFPATYQKH